MCTLIISRDPEARWPVLLASTRDEFRSRAWDPPDEWWPQEHPGVIGGRDREAGGTWLAVNPQARRVAVILNRIEPTGVSDREARSRGALPLIAAARGSEAIAPEDVGEVARAIFGEARGRMRVELSEPMNRRMGGTGMAGGGVGADAPPPHGFRYADRGFVGYGSPDYATPAEEGYGSRDDGGASYPGTGSAQGGGGAGHAEAGSGGG